MAKYVKQAYTGIDFYNSYMEFVKGNLLYEIEYKVLREIFVNNQSLKYIAEK